MYLQLDPLYNLLTTRPVQMGREMSMEPYPNRQFGLIDNPDRQSGSGSVPTWTRTRSDGPEPLLTLHTPSPAYTEYSIHRVQHTPSTQDCVSSHLSHDYELTPECSISVGRASLHARPPSANSPSELKGKVTLSHTHSCEVNN